MNLASREEASRGLPPTRIDLKIFHPLTDFERIKVVISGYRCNDELELMTAYFQRPSRKHIRET
jgi:hypothetical protein